MNIRPPRRMRELEGNQCLNIIGKMGFKDMPNIRFWSELSYLMIVDSQISFVSPILKPRLSI